MPEAELSTISVESIRRDMVVEGIEILDGSKNHITYDARKILERAIEFIDEKVGEYKDPIRLSDKNSLFIVDGEDGFLYEAALEQVTGDIIPLKPKFTKATTGGVFGLGDLHLYDFNRLPQVLKVEVF